MTTILTPVEVLVDPSGSLRKAAREFPELECRWTSPYIEEVDEAPGVFVCCPGALLAHACGLSSVGQLRIATPVRMLELARELTASSWSGYEQLGWALSALTQGHAETFEQAADRLESLGY